MSEQLERLRYQDRLQAGAAYSNIQPAVYFRSGMRPTAVGQFFTTPQALAYVHLRKEGDGYVRN